MQGAEEWCNVGELGCVVDELSCCVLEKLQRLGGTGRQTRAWTETRVALGVRNECFLLMF